MGIKEINKDGKWNYSSSSHVRLNKTEDRTRHLASTSVTNNKNLNSRKNIKQIFILSFDALKDRKARSALTILMVVVGSALMVALNSMSAGQAAFLNKQMNTLAPNILFVTTGQHGFRGGSSGTPTIVINTQVVNRLKSLPFVRGSSIISRIPAAQCAGKYSGLPDNSNGSTKGQID